MLLDTSGLLCYFNENDLRYSDASTFFAAAAKRLTHSYVLAEFVPLAQTRGFIRGDALAFLADLTDSPTVEVVWVDEALHREAMTLLQARMDKEYSLCDAVSFVLMQERGLTDALTTDHHFEQEGLRRLLPQR